MGQGKKSKAKARLDKYWSLAHQEGFRARSAYKLTQLNKKYGFLNRASTVVDLCAAPGGWMQVCQQVMPVTSTIVGVDLFPIKPIPGAKSLIGDITTDKTRKELLRELGGKKAEVVLHDGSPPVGGTWDKDAYIQNCLVLHAARFACQVLQPEGVFVTKVFRSADYTKILWVLESHFDKVEATKPPSSRNQSAEIFVVCRGYKAPKSLDMKFFNPQHVFSEIAEERDEGDIRVGMHHEDQSGYEIEIAVGGMRLHAEMPVSQFVRASHPENVVEHYGAITFKLPEDEPYAKSRHTSNEIVECCKDLKVLNKSDKVRLLKWRKSLWEDARAKRAKERRDAGTEGDDEAEEGSDQESASGQAGADGDAEQSGEDPEVSKMQRDLDAIKKHRSKQQKKKERKAVNSALQRAQRTNFNPEDNPLEVIAKQDGEMFKAPTAELLAQKNLAEANMDVDHVSLASDAQSMVSQELSEVGSESDIGSAAGDETGENNYYQRLDRLLDSAYREQRYEKIGHREEDMDEDDATSVASGRSGRSEGAADELKAAYGKAQWADSESEMSDASADSADSLDMDRAKKRQKDDNGDGRTSKSHKKIGFEEVPRMLRDPDNRAKVLAIGTRMLDKGARRDIIEAGVNRYSFNDDGLPKWFLEDEKRHHYIPIPVTKDEVELERARFKEINARPARKVLEAMHRKYQKAKRAVQKATESSKAAGGEQMRNKHVPSVRDVLRSKDMRNSHKKKKPLDNKTIGDMKRERKALAKKGKGTKRKR